MSLVVTPGKLSQLSEFYHQLGTMLSAGVTILQTLEQLYRAPPARSLRAPIRNVLTLLAEGATFSEAMAQNRGWLPSFDLALIEAGEQSGRLDACCRLLADHYRQRAALARRLMAELAYPAFLIHAAIFIVPTLHFIVLGGSLLGFVTQTFGLLLPIYLVIFLLILACQGRHGEGWRAALERVLHPIPVLGQARRNLALARLSAALEALLSAGVNILYGWELAATASGSPALRRAVYAWRPQLQAGLTPAELLRGTPQFPEVFANLYQTGEVSGSLDETLKRLYVMYQDEGARKLKAVVEWTPRVVYVLIASLMVWQIINTFVKGYIGPLKQVLSL
jgi:type II secretory pathway component PulF